MKLWPIILALLCTAVEADNRVSFPVQYGESREELEQWGRGALFQYFDAPVWEECRECDSEMVVVVQVCQLFNVDDPHLCMRLVVANPGWRARRGDRTIIQWEPNRWHNGEDGRFKLVQVRTQIR